MGKLSTAEVEEYFKHHLPYRIGILLAHYNMSRQSWHGDLAQLNACFVASLVTARMFLNMLGVGKDSDGELCAFKPRKKNSDDIMVDDLGG